VADGRGPSGNQSHTHEVATEVAPQVVASRISRRMASTAYRPVGMIFSMGRQSTNPSPTGGARAKLLAAAISLIREKGYAATSVDEVCGKAGVTKGAFFHHFASKDALAVAAVNHWSELDHDHFAAAPYHRFDDPLDSLLGYLDFRKAMLRGAAVEFSCLAGTMIQETYETHPEIRRACEACIVRHATEVESEIADAMKLHHIRATWTAESLALYIQAVLQGAFILAKAKGTAEVAAASVDHLRRYVESLFRRPGAKPDRKQGSSRKIESGAAPSRREAT